MDRVPEFWKTFGGNLIAVAAVGVMTLFNALSANLADLRRDVAALQSARAEYATAAEFEVACASVSVALSEIEGSPTSSGESGSEV